MTPFQRTKYLSFPLTFLLFSIHSTSHSSSPSIITRASCSFLCPSTCSTYCRTLLTLTTGCIFTVLGSSNLIVFDDTIFLILYRPTNLSINFSVLLPIIWYFRSLVLSMTKSPTLYSSASNLFLSAYFLSQLCHGPVVIYCMVYHYTKRATLARLLANEGPAIYVVHLNRYFVIPP